MNWIFFVLAAMNGVFLYVHLRGFFVPAAMNGVFLYVRLRGFFVLAAMNGVFLYVRLRGFFALAAMYVGKFVIRGRAEYFFVLIGLAGCWPQASPKTATITIATTTSTQDSGLLDVLIPLFKQTTHIEAKVIAVGSGQALELARRGDADVLLTHSAKAEEAFVAEGFGEDRIPVMFNDFVLVGPSDDPAGIMGGGSAPDAFKRIAERNSAFVSRGDDSGTHQKEMSLWAEAQREPAGDWYVKAGTGMAHTLRIAAEKRAYTLSDRATYLAQRTGLDLTVLVEKDSRLNNPYSVIVVSQKKHPHVQRESAHRFASFLRDPAAQKVIATFGQETYGQPLFFIGK